MLLVKPSHEILFLQPEPLKLIEAAGRTCYKSEDKITEGSAVKFVKMVAKRGHHSVIEHANMSVRFICDRGVTHELVRHRLASYSQECVIGSTQIKTGSTKKSIKLLYKKYKGLVSNGKTHIKTMSVKSINEDNIVINNKISHVFYKGIQPVYKLSTALGYQITCTLKHRFLTNHNEYVRLENLQAGDFIMVNGRPSLLKISDKKLKKLYEKEGLSPTEIAEQYNCPYRTVIIRLHKLGIFKPRKNDKDKEKYTKNHTVESYEKSRITNQKQYDNGREPWNKGIKEDEHPSVKKQGDSLRKNHWDNKEGEDNSNWKENDVSVRGGYARTQRNYELTDQLCEVCGQYLAEERHHIDEDPTNTDEDNILFVCPNCHKKLHFGWYIGTIVHEDEIESIEYIGKEKVYDLEMESPNHNYIADGFVTHNSTRYCNYGKIGMKFIIPGDFKLDVEDLALLDTIEKYYNKCLKEKHRTPQQARYFLPNGLKTEIVNTANLREWMHILNLRCSKAAHPQIRELMLPLLKELHQRVPVLFDDLYAKYVAV